MRIITIPVAKRHCISELFITVPHRACECLDYYQEYNVKCAVVHMKGDGFIQTAIRSEDVLC